MTERWIATVGAHSPGVNWSARAALLDMQLSGKSVGLRSTGAPGAASAALRSRAAYGASNRAEVIRAFHGVARGHGTSLTGPEIAWLSVGTRTQVNATLDELTDAGLVTRAGTTRRRSYAPAQGQDPLAHGLWSPWQQLPHAPWRLAPAVLGHLGRILEIPEGAPPRTSAVEAVLHYNEVLPSLARIDPAVAVAMSGGTAAEVLAQLRAHADRAVQRVVQVLRDGSDRASAPLLTVAPHAVPAFPVTQNPWRLRIPHERST